MNIRIYLTGRLCVEGDGVVLCDERNFHGKRDRLALAYLMHERPRPVQREELAEVLWGDDMPPAWDSALSATVSRLRQILQSLPLPAGTAAISHGSRSYELQLPAGIWVDTEY